MYNVNFCRKDNATNNLSFIYRTVENQGTTQEKWKSNNLAEKHFIPKNLVEYIENIEFKIKQ